MVVVGAVHTKCLGCAVACPVSDNMYMYTSCVR